MSDIATAIEDAPSVHPGAPHVLHPTQTQSTLKATRRQTWNSLISRLDKDQYTAFSCWLLLITSLCLFVVLLLAFGKQVCLVVFLSISVLVVLFVVFIQPPEGAYRRQAMREVLWRQGPASNGAVGGATASVRSRERGITEPAGSTSAPQQAQQKKYPTMGGLKMKQPSHQGSPAYELRKASMLFEKYDDTVRLNMPPSRPSTLAAPAPKEPKRGFLSFLARIRKGRLQASPYYTTLTEDEESNQEDGENASPMQSHAEAAPSVKREVPETRKHIGFQDDQAPAVEAEQHAGGTRRNRRLSQRQNSETELIYRGRVDRSPSIFTSVTPSSGATGLKPLKSGVKGTSTPRLGVSAKKAPGIVPRRAVNFSGASTPALHKKAPPHLLKVDDWRKVADSSDSTSEEGGPNADSGLLFPGPPKAAELSDVKKSFKLRQSRASSLSPDQKVGPSKTYTMRDGTKGIRKVYHVWGM